jgi:hypothetical protein
VSEGLWIKDKKGLERKWPLLFPRYYTGIRLEVLNKTTKASVTIASKFIDIRVGVLSEENCRALPP